MSIGIHVHVYVLYFNRYLCQIICMYYILYRYLCQSEYMYMYMYNIVTDTYVYRNTCIYIYVIL